MTSKGTVSDSSIPQKDLKGHLAHVLACCIALKMVLQNDLGL